jgi:hypothetical protein
MDLVSAPSLSPTGVRFTREVERRLWGERWRVWMWGGTVGIGAWAMIHPWAWWWGAFIALGMGVSVAWIYSPRRSTFPRALDDQLSLSGLIECAWDHSAPDRSRALPSAHVVLKRAAHALREAPVTHAPLPWSWLTSALALAALFFTPPPPHVWEFDHVSLFRQDADSADRLNERPLTLSKAQPHKDLSASSPPQLQDSNRAHTPTERRAGARSSKKKRRSQVARGREPDEREALTGGRRFQRPTSHSDRVRQARRGGRAEGGVARSIGRVKSRSIQRSKRNPSSDHLGRVYRQPIEDQDHKITVQVDLYDYPIKQRPFLKRWRETNAHHHEETVER